MLATACFGPSHGVPATAVTAHSLHAGVGSTDLLMPRATTATARAAIRKYADGISGASLYYVKVEHAAHADRYVCRAKWYRDAASWQVNGDQTAATPTTWPHLTIYCRPDEG